MLDSGILLPYTAAAKSAGYGHRVHSEPTGSEEADPFKTQSRTQFRRSWQTRSDQESYTTIASPQAAEPADTGSKTDAKTDANAGGSTGSHSDAYAETGSGSVTSAYAKTNGGSDADAFAEPDSFTGSVAHTDSNSDTVTGSHG